MLRERISGIDLIIEGEGPAILFIPGTTGNPLFFEDLVNQLQSQFTCYRIYHPNLPVDNYIAKLNAIISEIKNNTHNNSLDKGVQIVNIFGTSVGGFIAQFLAARASPIVNKVILSNSFHDPKLIDNPSKFTRIMMKILPYRLIRWIFLRGVNSSLSNVDEAAQNQIYSLVQQELLGIGKSEFIQRVLWTVNSKVPPKLNLPILNISSSNDPVIDEQTTSSLVKYHQNVQQLNFEKSGNHFPYIVNSEKVAESIKSFL